MHNYLITFDGSRLNAESQKHFELMLTNHKLVDGWSSPFPGAYFVKSAAKSAEEISDSIEDFFNRKGIFVARIEKTGAATNGRLPGTIWDFLKE